MEHITYNSVRKVETKSSFFGSSFQSFFSVLNFGQAGEYAESAYSKLALELKYS